MNAKKVVVILLVGLLVITSLAARAKGDTNNPGVFATSKDDVELLISAAASLTDVLNELKEVYKTIEPETTITYTFGASGALQSQIEEGAPVDVFISAAQKQMKDLDENDLIVNGTIRTLLVNKIVLIVPSDSKLEISSFEDIIIDEVGKVAIGDPASVPVGQYSEEIFTNLNLTEKVDPKLILASDVRTVLTWVESGEVDCGIVYATDAYTSDNIKIITEAPEGSHKDVSYPAGIVEGSKNVDSSQAFLDFLSTDEAVKLFEKHGFSMK